MIFLRPYFLLLLLVPFLFWINAKMYIKSSAWATVCDAHLLPYLTVDVSGKKSKSYRVLMLVLWCIVSIALSGPVVLKKDIQTGALQSGLVVVVDMSPTMDKKSTDQLIHKLYDIADYEKDLTIALVLTDEKAYTALPLTQDKSILKNIIPTLKENVMPSRGENIQDGVALAGRLLQQSGFKKGQILLLTAGVIDAKNVAKVVKTSKYPVCVIGIGDRRENSPVFLSDGSFWENGKMAGLSDLKDLLGKKFKFATIDEKDLNELLTNRHFEQAKNLDSYTTQYQDVGIWFVVLLLPFVALLFRKGVLFCLVLLYALPAQAGFLWRSEQEAYQARMQAIADFNMGHYEDALKGFQSVCENDVETLYNIGNTLAYLGKIDEAIQTYENVLKQNPKHEDAAFNLEYLKRQQPPSSSQGNGASQNQSEQSEQGEQNQSSGRSTQNSQEKNSEQQAGQSQDKSNEQQTKGNSQEKETEDNQTNQNEEQKQNNGDAQKQSKAELSDKENQQQGNEEQAVMTAADQKQKEWLDRIDFDAGRVLKYRLFKQYEAQK